MAGLSRTVERHPRRACEVRLLLVERADLRFALRAGLAFVSGCLAVVRHVPRRRKAARRHRLRHAVRCTRPGYPTAICVIVTSALVADVRAHRAEAAEAQRALSAIRIRLARVSDARADVRARLRLAWADERRRVNASRPLANLAVGIARTRSAEHHVHRHGRWNRALVLRGQGWRGRGIRRLARNGSVDRSRVLASDEKRQHPQSFPSSHLDVTLLDSTRIFTREH